MHARAALSIVNGPAPAEPKRFPGECRGGDIIFLDSRHSDPGGGLVAAATHAADTPGSRSPTLRSSQPTLSEAVPGLPQKVTLQREETCVDPLQVFAGPAVSSWCAGQPLVSWESACGFAEASGPPPRGSQHSRKTAATVLHKLSLCFSLVFWEGLGSVIRNIVGGLDGPQLLVLCGHIRQLMK
jgi:hypothetical protein